MRADPRHYVVEQCAECLAYAAHGTGRIVGRGGRGTAEAPLGDHVVARGVDKLDSECDARDPWCLGGIDSSLHTAKGLIGRGVRGDGNQGMRMKRPTDGTPAAFRMNSM